MSSRSRPQMLLETPDHHNHLAHLSSRQRLILLVLLAHLTPPRSAKHLWTSSGPFLFMMEAPRSLAMSLKEENLGAPGIDSMTTMLLRPPSLLLTLLPILIMSSESLLSMLLARESHQWDQTLSRSKRFQMELDLSSSEVCTIAMLALARDYLLKLRFLVGPSLDTDGSGMAERSLSSP